MKVLLPTNNKIKIEKWGGLIKDLGYELVTLKDLDIVIEESKEDGNSVLENALKKGEYYYKKTGLVTVTTDSSLYIDGLSRLEQIGLFAGRKVVKDELGNIISDEQLTDEENYQRYKSILEGLGSEVKGYFEEGIVIYYGTNTYDSKTFRMNRIFKTPGSTTRKENAPMRIFTYYPELDKYRSEMTNEEANKIEGKTFREQKDFFSSSLYKVDHLMEYNFDILLDRLLDANSKLTNEELTRKLKDIRNSCICIGTGGSFAASVFASRVLDAKNQNHNHKMISGYCEPLDFLENKNRGTYDNMLAITYGNKNHGVTLALRKAREEGLSTYIITANNESQKEDNLIYYPLFYPREYSFISIASTLSPMSLMLKYYLNLDDYNINSLLHRLYNNASQKQFISEEEAFNEMKVIEIMSDYNTASSSRVLESTIVESGLGFPIIHDKYGYCHGRSVTSFHHQGNIIIYLVNGEKTTLDEKLIAALQKQNSYQTIVFLTTDSNDKILGEFDLSIQSLFLCREIANNLNKSLSKVEYPNIVKTLYSYKGELTK